MVSHINTFICHSIDFVWTCMYEEVAGAWDKLHGFGFDDLHGSEVEVPSEGWDAEAIDD